MNQLSLLSNRELNTIDLLVEIFPDGIPYDVCETALDLTGRVIASSIGSVMSFLIRPQCKKG